MTYSSNVCSPNVEPTPVFTLEEYHSLRQKHLGVVTSSRPGDLISGIALLFMVPLLFFYFIFMVAVESSHFHPRYCRGETNAGVSL